MAERNLGFCCSKEGRIKSNADLIPGLPSVPGNFTGAGFGMHGGTPLPVNQSPNRQLIVADSDTGEGSAP
jgi:hypothetical protein